MADVGAVLRVLDGYPAPLLLGGAGLSAAYMLAWAWHMVHDAEDWHRKLAERQARSSIRRWSGGGDAEREFARLWRWRWWSGAFMLGFLVVSVVAFFQAIGR